MKDPRPEKRLTRRFPLQLPVAVTTKAMQDRTNTENISAGGVSFYVDSEMEVGANVVLSIRMPAGVLGAPRDVLVNCAGRVVRCSRVDGRNSVAVVIYEYDFERDEGTSPAPDTTLVVPQAVEK